jgi:hypothetical protein
MFDGEGTERLWSFLGKFSLITKEMTPENRTDLFVEALLHYTARLRDNLGIEIEITHALASLAVASF